METCVTSNPKVAVCQMWNYAVETDLINNSNCQYGHKCNSDSSTVWGRQEQQPRKSSRRRVQRNTGLSSDHRPASEAHEGGRQQQALFRGDEAAILTRQNTARAPLPTSSLPDGGLGTYRTISYLPGT